jgi:HAD superfamily hydrolase (TIGR01450 family)
VTSGELGPLAASETPLSNRYDVALLDLDGVVYIGTSAVTGAAAALAAARERGMRLAFVTNNAARPPSSVAAHLNELGIQAQPDEVITSAQAAARYLAELLPPNAPVLVVGTVGLDEALTERGLRPVHSADDHPAAVVQGYSPTLDWALLAEGCVAIRRGVPWVATNLDPTVPSPRGPLPGNGSLVAALRHATGVTPQVTGKPDPHMHRETIRRTGARKPLVVGDRLDTDIEGAQQAGCPSLLVMSGVTGPRELLAAPPPHRPTYLGNDVGAILSTHPPVAFEGSTWRCGQWSVEVSGAVASLSHGSNPRADSAATAADHDQGGVDGLDGVEGVEGVEGVDGVGGADGVDALRVLARAVWAAADRGVELTSIDGADDEASAELNRMGLA